MTDEELFNLSDEELEAAFREAKADFDSPVTDIEENFEEDAEDTLEYPDDQDSDDDASLTDEEEEDSEDDSEEEEGELDGDPETDEEQTEDDEEELDDDEQPVQDEIYSFRANGQDYNFTIDEMKAQFGKVFGQAMDYTKKMQSIKPYRKTIDAIESAGLTNDDINLMIDVLKGDKDAMAQVLKRTGTDALDLDLENSNYVAKDYGRDETELTIRDIVDDISRDKEYAITHNVLEKQWDDKSRNEFIKDPEMIRLLHVDVKSGMFDRINPMAQKLKVYDGGKRSDLDYYKEAAQQYFEGQAQYEAQIAAQESARQAEEARRAEEAERVAQVKVNQSKQVATKEASAKRKAAAPTTKKVGNKKAVDYLDDSDEAFEEWYSKLQDGQ